MVRLDASGRRRGWKEVEDEADPTTKRADVSEMDKAAPFKHCSKMCLLRMI